MNADQFQSRLRWMANDKICVEVALTAELLHNFSEKLPCPKWYSYFLWLKADWSKYQGKSPYLSKWGHNYIQYAKIHNLISKKLKQSIIYNETNNIFYVWFYLSNQRNNIDELQISFLDNILLFSINEYYKIITIEIYRIFKINIFL